MSFPHYKISVQWATKDGYDSVSFVQMFSSEMELADIKGRLLNEWWPEFKRRLSSQPVIAPMISVSEAGWDTWCWNRNGYYWTYYVGQSYEQVQLDWELYRDQWGIEGHEKLCRCQYCIANGIFRMDVTRPVRIGNSPLDGEI